MMLKINTTANPVTQGFDDCSDCAISVTVGKTDPGIVYWSDVVKLYHEFKNMWGDEADRLESIYIPNIDNLSDKDFDILHDIIAEVRDERNPNYSISEVLSYWNILPKHIKAECKYFGVSDTVCKDHIYEFLKDLRNKAKK